MTVTVMGDYAGPYGDVASEDVKRKTAPANPPTVVQSGGTNVLNSYRSVNYIFTLAALDMFAANTPASYRDSELNNVILKSGGKGTTGLSGKVTPQQRTYTPSTKSADGNVTTKSTPTTKANTATTYIDFSGEVLVDTFNKDSPGRFDMFIENIEVESTWTASDIASVSQPNSIKFDVIEPYSINGFIEALQASAIASGYPTYTNASFLLKLEFIGYPDTDKFTKAESVPLSTRYFPIRITNVEVTIDEKGTKYAVKAVPWNEAGFGNASVIKSPIKISGGTVSELLADLAKNLNQQVVDSDKDSSKIPFTVHDTYEIKFPSWSDRQGFVGEQNKISKASAVDPLRDNASYIFAELDKNPNPDAYDPKSKNQPTTQENSANPEIKKTVILGKKTVQFPENSRITECIASVIRDSEYLKTMLKALSSKEECYTVIDTFGMVEYFMVQVDVYNKGTINPISKKPFQNYTFNVVPHKIHYTRIPGYGGQVLDTDKLKQLSQREYNYIYTGKNTDVLSFKLNFNTLYFEALPKSLGGNDGVPSRYAAGRNGRTDPKINADNLTIARESGGMSAGVQVDASQTSVRTDSGGVSTDDPYAVMARNMHDAIVNSKGSMLTGEIEIIGDPYYISTGGIGGYNPRPVPGNPRSTTDGEIAHNYGDCFITINFANPIDISTLERGGRMYFKGASYEPVPFSGVYRVTTLVSTFRDGKFQQKLSVIRVPGQIPNSSVPVTFPGSRFEQEVIENDIQESDAGNVATQDSVINSNSGLPVGRATTFDLIKQLLRGLPSPGLPGELSNFTNATGGLGGAVINAAVATAVNGVSVVQGAVLGNTGLRLPNTGAPGQLINFTNAPGGLARSISSGILAAGVNGVSVIQGTALGNGGLVGSVANSVNALAKLKNPGRELAGVITNIAIGKINQLAVPGSGIGIGGVPYVPVSSAASIVASGALLTTQALQDSNIQGVAPGVSDPLTGIAAGIGISTMARVAKLSNLQQAGLINGVNLATQAALWGVPQDPVALATQFGINASQIAGLSPNLTSRVLNDLRTIASIVPSNVDVGSYSNNGLNMVNLDAHGLKSLPPNQPYSIAPDPAVDSRYLDSVTVQGGAVALARAYGVATAVRISQSQLPAVQRANALSFVAPTLLGALSSYLPASINDVAQTGLRILTVADQVSQTIKSVGSRENSLSNVIYRTGATVATGGSLATAVTSKFGSVVNTTNPIDRLIKNNR